MALKVSHAGYVIEVGRIVFDGDRDALLNNPDIQEFYLGKKQAIGREKRRWKLRKTWR
jgi:branched-chain amino acid transport system ATP-binding protein